MRTLHPPAVYIVESVLADPAAKARADCFMGRVEAGSVEVVSDARLAELIESNGWSESRRLSGRQRHGDPPIVLDVYRFDGPEWATGAPPRQERAANRLGPHRGWHFRSGAGVGRGDGLVCQDGYGINTAYGCLFKCDYCYFEDVLLLNLNLEALLERLDPIIRAAPSPSLWKWDNLSDTLCFEPEMGAAGLFVEYFAQFDDRYLMTYSKSDNVDCLLDLDHRGQTICCWTLNADTQSRLIERGAATTEERIEAARKCQQAGYRVRFRFSAICPVRDWERENAEMLDRLFDSVRPDVITLETLSRMPDKQMFENVMQPELFEPRFLEAIRRGSPEIEGRIWGPLPDDLREELYRWFIREIRRRSPDTPVSLCQEPASMWKRLADVLAYGPEHYPCACAVDSVPGGHPAFA